MNGISVKDPNTNTDFGVAVLYAIATDARLRRLRDEMVIKGGAALLLGWDSGRATRKDLDFDVRHEITISEADAQALFRALAKWKAGYVPGGAVRSGTDSHAIGKIAFQDPRNRNIGQIEIQISQRRLPPTLAEKIESKRFTEPLTGVEFDFPTMCLEGIAAEKMIRAYKHQDEQGRPILAVSVNDMYDIGFIADWRPSIDRTEVKKAFNGLCVLEASGDIRLEATRLDRLALDVYKATDVKTLFGDKRVIDLAAVGFAKAKRRVLEGIRATKGIGGLDPALPAPADKR